MRKQTQNSGLLVLPEILQKNNHHEGHDKLTISKFSQNLIFCPCSFHKDQMKLRFSQDITNYLCQMTALAFRR